jgi:dTDP-4-dehydrorhamnose 3,5-epimerase
VYNKESEGSLLWNDTDLNIDWRIETPLVSDKDLLAGGFKNFESQF